MKNVSKSFAAEAEVRIDGESTIFCEINVEFARHLIQDHRDDRSQSDGHRDHWINKKTGCWGSYDSSEQDVRAL